MVEGNIDSCSCTFSLAMVVGIDIRKVEVAININVEFSACQSIVLPQGNGERLDYSVSLCSNVSHHVRMIIGSSDFRVESIM